jgi:hypothetical protein
MSEYHYYEFRAIDRALNDRQMRELRAISTRAAISRTSFSNYYTFGDLKANPRDLLTKYFDVSLYFANWFFLEVAFRYPKGAVDVRALRRYARGHTIAVRSTAQHVSISAESDGESFDVADDGSGWLSALIGLRAELASGDDRILYLGWLLDVQSGEIEDDAVEPARPEELGNLAPALASFIDIVGIERDLVAAAAEDGAELARRFRQHMRGRATTLPLRTAGELRARAAATAERRRKAAGEREARMRAVREREERAARDRYLNGLAKRERQAWQRVDALIGDRRPADYAAAVTLLVDLRDVSGRKGRDTAFAQGIGSLRRLHATKPSLLMRLRKAGL